MKILIFLITSSILLLGINSCQSSQIKSLCVLDPDAGKCWVDKGQNKGFNIYDMKCKETGSGEVKCWYSIYEDDFRKIVDKLNKCKSGK